MDDKVSQWLLRWWYPDDIAALPRGEVLATAGLARLINWPDSLRGLVGDVTGYRGWNKREVFEHLEARKARGEKVFTGVYIVSASGAPSGANKIQVVVDLIDRLSRSGDLLREESMEATWCGLQSIPGIGSFMAGQIVADLRHVYPGPWADRMQWAPLGKGSRRGMAWLLGWDGRAPLATMTQSEFEGRIRVRGIL